MPLFAVCDVVLESAVPFPELALADGNRADLSFELRDSGPLLAKACEWFHRWESPGGKTWLLLGKRARDYLLRFPDLADFLVSAAGKSVGCFPHAETPAETIRHLFLDQVLPLVLSQRGRVVLHASAVAGPEGAVAFLGATGAGKSTLAGSFCRSGWPLLTDDCFLLREQGEQIAVVPSYPGLRLWEDSLAGLDWKDAPLAPSAHYTEKQRIQAGSGSLTVCRDAMPLAKLFVLEPPDSSGTQPLSIAALRPSEALIELVQCSYCLDITDRERIRQQFELLGRVAASAPVCRLQFPRDYSQLAAVREAILCDRKGS